MCGIAGFAGYPTDTPLKAMTRSLTHRGPDNDGFFVTSTAKGVVALGHRRLSIVDLEAGTQPLSSEDGRVTAVVNGEIYNHVELRGKLERLGHRFETRSDSEVIVHLYEEAGPDCFGELDGMYAIALFDARENRLLLGRDPIGKKPLYFAVDGERVLFGSEPKALLAGGFVPARISRRGLDLYLRFGYVPAPHTLFAGIESIPAGGWLSWEAGEITRGFHFELYDAIDPDVRELDFGAAVAQTRSRLAHAVEKRLAADVPVGVWLSGGIDSTLIATLAARSHGEGLRTFTVGHPAADASFDECARARATARAIGASHTEVRVEPAVDAVFERLLDVFDEPFADSSAIPTQLISEVTAQELKVVLSGVGGDEGFAGYPRHGALRWAQALEWVPALARRAGAGLLRPWVRESADAFNTGGRVRRFLDAAALPAESQYLRWVTLFHADARAALLGTRLGNDSDSPARATAGAVDSFDFAFRHDAGAYLPEDLLRLTDRASMVHGLEVRAPFCDPSVLGFGLSLSPKVKLAGGLKSVLRGVAADLVPPEVLRAPKRGFMVPVARWLRDELAPLADSLLSEQACRKGGLLQYAAVRPLWEQHRSGRANHAQRIWALVLLQAWRAKHPYLEMEPACES